MGHRSPKLRSMGIDGDFVAGPGRHPWVVGGSLLLGSAVVGVTTQPWGAPVSLLGTLAASVAFVVFALGFHGRGSVTGPHRAGTIALCTLAAWTLFAALVSAFFSPVIITGPPALGFLNEIISLAMATIAVVAIGRSQVVPRPWNWAPAAALACWVGLWLVEQMLREAVVTSTLLASALQTVDTLVHVGTPVFLGATAIALANRTGARPTSDAGILDPGVLLSVLDGVIRDAVAAEALIGRLDNQARPTPSDAREGQQLRFSLATADRALAAAHVPPVFTGELDEMRRTVAYYQHMIKLSLESGFSAILADPPRLQHDGSASRSRVDRLVELRQSLSSTPANTVGGASPQ